MNGKLDRFNELRPSLWMQSGLIYRDSVAGEAAAGHLPWSGARSALLRASMLLLAVGLSGASAAIPGSPSLNTDATMQQTGVHVTGGTLDVFPL